MAQVENAQAAEIADAFGQLRDAVAAHLQDLEAPAVADLGRDVDEVVVVEQQRAQFPAREREEARVSVTS